MKITVLGLGFVGLTTGLGFAKKGFQTYGFDVDSDRLNSLKSFKIPFHEPHLEDILKETFDKSFYLDVDFETAIKDSDAIFLCVGTPSKEDGSADLKYIYAAIEQVLNVNTDKLQVIITKSTVPPSTVSQKIIPFVEEKLEKLPGRKVVFASNPEFLREGYCWEDFIEPDRIVIGVEEENAKSILDEIYKPFNAPIHYVSYNSAEFIKYLSNTLLSTLISYANEMSVIAGKIGDIDIPKAFRILHEDKRWFGAPAGMSKYVYPGCGYGGYCLPKDTSALVQKSIESGFEPKILKANIDINDKIKYYITESIEKKVEKSDSIGILGLSFKPESDDVRITPTKAIIELLFEKGYHSIHAYDPIANEEFKKFYPDMAIDYCNSLDELLSKSNNLLVLTGWKEFVENKDKIQTKTVFDYRYIY
ncbi:UDP-glucose/GDP-mannose dehydrogenase family protein [uncultured Sunxiuqinia sp.]|uniref:UDP-glucose dehydrogenase family protein n=1 Tax=uncultured Sunxiuqinia sp. TaxID=1573825 RepID=UPI002AA94DD2|nr:UDP-glucose/GDP-mannose dehydrogenase family protein [uncultured Sunxiuqinia sp.]